MISWRAYPGSRIERLPKALQLPALAARNVKTLFEPSPPHRADGITTINNDSFRREPTFKRAYARAVKAAGWDYQIPYRVHQAIWCVSQSLRVEGDIVELGTGRGFVMSAVLEALSPKRPVHLFDTFLPFKPTDSGEQSGNVSTHYADTFELVVHNFAEWPNVILHKGDLFETLPRAEIGHIAFLHVDLNHPKPEEFGIRNLWPKMPKGAVMLLDDYANRGFEPQYRLHNELAEEFGFNILTTPTGQGIVIK